MDMKKILENMDAAAAGKKPAATDTGSMKAILESLNKVEECGMDMAPQEMSQNQGNPVTVSITASGKDNVNDLMDLIKLAGGGEQHVDIASHNTDAMDMAAMRSAIMGPDTSEEEPLMITKDDEDEVEEWANSPEGVEGEEEYKDHEYMTRDLSGGINRAKPKGSERAKDPAVESIKEKLWAALSEKKTTEGRGKLMASRGRGKKKAKEDIKTTEGRGRGRGRGKKK